MHENVPSIEYLDEEPVNDGFFDRKTDEIKKNGIVKKV